jgi:hypothetical protein
MKNETSHIIQMMKATGNQPGIIARWKTLVEEWACKNNWRDPDAKAVSAWIPSWQVRPFYTATELAPLWPALAIATGYTSHWPAVTKSAKRLEHELDFYGLPHFRMNGQKFYIVEQIHKWKNADLEELYHALDR